jgi:hypothetical protein
MKTVSRTALGPTQSPIQWVPGALSLGAKRPGREADHSPPSSAEVKECVRLYLHSPIRLHDVVLSHTTEAQGQIYLYLEDGGSMDLRNVSILPKHYAASQPRKPRLENIDAMKA